MPQGPVSRIVLRRFDGRTEIIGRAGHIDPSRITAALKAAGDVLVVRHEMMPKSGKHETIAIHEMGR